MPEPLPYKPREAFGANVKYWRTRRRLSGQNLADRLTRSGLEGFSSKASISHVENGKRTVGVDDLLTFAQALNVSPLTLICPTSEVLIDGSVVSPEHFQMWLRMIVPLPIGNGTKQDLLDHAEKFLETLPPHETKAFQSFEGLHHAWVALANIIANIADGDLDGAEFRTFSLLKDLSQVFDLITKAQKRTGTQIVLATGQNKLLDTEWQAIRNERDDLLDRLEVNQQKSRQLESQLLAKREQK